MDIKKYLLDFYVEHKGETIDPEIAKCLVYEMAITDGSERTTGEKWTISETSEIGNKMGINWDKISKSEWYLVLNMMYSDYYSVGRKHGMTDYNFYAELSRAWFEDVDGADNKTFKYFFA